MAKKRKFDYSAHNKKIAKLRGEKWRASLKLKKLEASETPTLIRQKRVLKDLSQTQFAKKLGIKNLTTYARIERGEASVDQNLAKKIALHLGLSVKKSFILNQKNKFQARPL